jgi:hypothetical protein
MKYRVVSWKNEDGSPFLLNKENSIIELESINGLDENDFDINSSVRPYPDLPNEATISPSIHGGESTVTNDDSWKVTWKDWVASPLNAVSYFTNSKLEPWVMKCMELESEVNELKRRNSNQRELIVDNRDKNILLEAENKKLQDFINQLKSVINGQD